MTLTPRELEVLQLLVDGVSRKGIAVQLHVNLQCVHYYARQVRYKLRADTMEQAVAKALVMGIVKVEAQSHVTHGIMTKSYISAN